MENHIFFPPEWHQQSGVQLTWPHENTDWRPILNEVIPCFVCIAKEIAKREKLLIVCHDEETVRQQLKNAEIDEENIIFRTIQSNDSWARDHGGISVLINGKPTVYDFVFNGWGMKYPANHDNMITVRLFNDSPFGNNVGRMHMLPFILEGGSIDTDGRGTLMTTSKCMFSYNRNGYIHIKELEYHLENLFGIERVLWLDNGFLEGDDTDSHIDTLARFCSEDTIAYVQCTDPADEHYNELLMMEGELRSFWQLNGKPYRLIPLPMADPVYWEGERLPATYANFLIINEAVLLPFYNSPKDQIAKEALEAAFPNREVIGINCLPLIKQHGSLHCVTMQYPEGFIQ